MRTTPPITAASAPDLVQVRAWLERMIAALKFVDLVIAIVALIGRMRDINTELVKRLAHLQRKRPRSETLERLERQLALPFDALVATAPKLKKSRKGHPPGARRDV